LLPTQAARPATWWRRLLAVAAYAYPAGLLGLTVALNGVGERWWVTGLGLYVPRFVFAAPLPVLVVALVAAGLPRLLWTQLLAAGLCVFPLMGFNVRAPAVARGADGRAPGPSLRLLSYNVEAGLGPGGYRAVIAEIDRYSPDIAFLEACSTSESLLGPLRERFPVVYQRDQFVVATRFAISETREATRLPHVDPAHATGHLRVALDTPLGHIVGYAVHPVSPRVSLYLVRGSGRAGVLSGRAFGAATAAEFYANAALRESQLQEFAAAAQQETDPVLVAGDTNVPDLSAFRRWYLSSFDDAFREVGWGFGYTFPTNNKRLSPWMRIDRVLASHALRFVRFQVGDSRASDHLCVVADVVRR
jgi:hypothetical protein